MREPEEMLKVPELAKMLKTSESSIYNFINRGILPAFKIGGIVRVDRKDYDATIAKLKSKSIPVPQ